MVQNNISNGQKAVQSQQNNVKITFDEGLYRLNVVKNLFKVCTIK